MDVVGDAEEVGTEIRIVFTKLMLATKQFTIKTAL